LYFWRLSYSPVPGVRKSGIPALQETPAPVSTTIFLYLLEASILATLLMDCGAFAMDDGCLGAMETLPKVAVRSSMLTSFLLVVVDSIFSSSSDLAAVCEEPLGMLTWLSLSLAACGFDFDPIA